LAQHFGIGWSVGGGGPEGRQKRDAGGAQRERGAGGTSQEAFAVVLDLGLGQGVDVGDNLGPGA
jgi:hypothetical protein